MDMIPEFNMGPLLLVIISITALVLLIKWRLKKAEQRLLGKSVSFENRPQHPDGTLYYFYHPRCGPCRSMMPVIDELINRYPDRIIKVNVAENREMTISMGIRATPTMLLINDNKISMAIIGAKSEKFLEKILNTNSI
jgi:thiol-disulfide isomerase/thioredoxin